KGSCSECRDEPVCPTFPGLPPFPEATCPPVGVRNGTESREGPRTIACICPGYSKAAGLCGYTPEPAGGYARRSPAGSPCPPRESCDRLHAPAPPSRREGLDRN